MLTPRHKTRKKVCEASKF